MRATLISGAVKESRVCSFEGGKAKTLHPHSLVSMVLYAKDIVETDFLSLPPDTSVLQAAKAMATRHQGFAVVTTPDKGGVGIVTEWRVLGKEDGPDCGNAPIPHPGQIHARSGAGGATHAS